MGLFNTLKSFLIKLTYSSGKNKPNDTVYQEEEIILTPNDLIGIDVLIKNFLINVGRLKKVRLIKNELPNIEPNTNLINNSKISQVSLIYRFDLDNSEKENIAHFGARTVLSLERKDINKYPPRKKDNEELTKILVSEFNVNMDTSDPMTQIKFEIESIMINLIINNHPRYKKWVYNSFWSVFLSNILIQFTENSDDNSYFLTLTFIFR